MFVVSHPWIQSTMYAVVFIEKNPHISGHIHFKPMFFQVKVAQLCPTLCDPMDHTVHRILQARILEWVAIPFSRVSSQPRDQTQVSHIAGGFFTS